MHPYINIGFVEIPSYGVMLAIAFIVSLVIASKRAEKEGIEPNLILDLAFWVAFFGILGGRLYFVVEHFNYYLQKPWEVFYLWQGGLGIYGALVLGFTAGVFYLKRKGLPFLKVADIAFSVLPIGQGIGRIGCFLAGCCYGSYCEYPIGVIFRDPRSLAPIGVRIWPTQLFESALCFLIFIYLSFVFNKSKKDGEIMFLYFILYGFVRFVVEFFRGDPRTYLGLISTPQFFSILFIIIGIAGLIFINRKTKNG
ncbi:MAG: prolipoprotein diacylglyceryl transferase [Thermosulfidibacteraceae bacterium]|jgi:phosphatidylglycerol:prolipoprotein diacylglycerol transferase